MDQGRIARTILTIASLLRTRWEQAQREGRVVVRNLITGAILIVVAGALVALAVPLAMVAGILLLAKVVPVWAAVGLVLAAILLLAGVLLLVARRKLRARRFAVVEDLRKDVATIRKTLGRET